MLIWLREPARYGLSGLCSRSEHPLRRLSYEPLVEAPFRIELTDEQRKQIKEQAGVDAKVVEFEAEVLEDRIAPIRRR